MMSQTPPLDNQRPVASRRIAQALERQGCTATDWHTVYIHPDTDIKRLRNVEFEGKVYVGELNENYPDSCIRNALLRNCSVGDGVRIRNIRQGIINANIGCEAIIEDCGLIEFEFRYDWKPIDPSGWEPIDPSDLDPEEVPNFGVGARVAVLDETGGHGVIMYPGLSAQEAMLMARAPENDAEKVRKRTCAYIESMTHTPGIGRYTSITGCGTIKNVDVYPGSELCGCTSLQNGTIVSNVLATISGRPIGMSAYIGAGVDAKDFIVEDATVESGAVLRNCYVGQGVKIGMGATAHDSLFFANCTFENGEACALFAGPYTVSMHKGTLLIGCQTSFMNAGSATNQSNHMYKLGPVHWGVLERGVKTSSNSYLMHGANIGAFSLLMGMHKTHPDSREFPFSYLCGDPSGATVVVPGVMLRSCGLLRDEAKWPERDRRKGLTASKRDRIIFDILNPATVRAILTSIATIEGMLRHPADDDRYFRHKGMKLARASMERALKLYRNAIAKYLSVNSKPIEDCNLTAQEVEAAKGGWVDLAGLPMPRAMMERAIEAETVEEARAIFDRAYNAYGALQQVWISANIPEGMFESQEDIERAAAKFDRLAAGDREQYLESLAAETAMLHL